MSNSSLASSDNAIRPRRSVLYMPGSKQRALEKGKELDCDAIIFDLEDAVAPAMKDEARAQVCTAMQQGGYGKRECIIRANGLLTPWGEDDLKAIAQLRPAGSGAGGAAGGGKALPHAVLLPKIQTAAELEQVRKLLSSFGADPDLKLWAMMETPLAMLNAKEIAEAGISAQYALQVFVMGTNDLAKETRAALIPGRSPMLSWLSTCIAAARAYGLEIIDGVYNDFNDKQGFRAECEEGRELGMDGKTLIHPGQIAVCNKVFSPSEDEIAWSRKIIAAFELPENKGQGAITVDGRMMELLHAEIARRVVTIADAIEAQKGE